MAVVYCLATELLMKAGANVNSTASGATYLEAFGEMAESYINVATNYNWSDWYAAYSATYPDVSQLLVDAATSKAAIDIINYDLSGFTNIQEATQRVNVLYSNFQAIIALLKDESKRDFTRTGGPYP